MSKSPPNSDRSRKRQRRRAAQVGWMVGALVYLLTFTVLRGDQAPIWHLLEQPSWLDWLNHWHLTDRTARHLSLVLAALCGYLAWLALRPSRNWRESPWLDIDAATTSEGLAMSCSRKQIALMGFPAEMQVQVPGTRVKRVPVGVLSLVSGRLASSELVVFYPNPQLFRLARSVDE